MPDAEVFTGSSYEGPTGASSFGQPGGMSFGQQGSMSFGQQGGMSFGQQTDANSQPGSMSFGQQTDANGQTYTTFGQTAGSSWGQMDDPPYPAPSQHFSPISLTQTAAPSWGRTDPTFGHAATSSWGQTGPTFRQTNDPPHPPPSQHSTFTPHTQTAASSWGQTDPPFEQTGTSSWGQTDPAFRQTADLPYSPPSQQLSSTHHAYFLPPGASSPEGPPSVPPPLDTAAIQQLASSIYTNRDTVEVSSARGDVLAEHRVKSKSRMPSPLALMCPPSHRTSSCSSFRTASASAFSVHSDAHNYHHPYSRAGSTTGLRSHDKTNTRKAGYNFLATLSVNDCWMSSCEIRRGWARDSLLYANQQARDEKREETVESDIMLQVVSMLYFTPGNFLNFVRRLSIMPPVGGVKLSRRPSLASTYGASFHPPSLN